jgi:spore coat polysaccharide biosynthesis protein SpsF
MPDSEFVGFVTVRTSSSRLPAKCLLPFGDGTVLHHMIRRTRAFSIDPIVCTSTHPSDDAIEDISRAEGARCFRGSLSNKLRRWSDCAAHFGLTAFHTIDADDPFFDGEEVRQSMVLLVDGSWDMVCPTEASAAGAASVGYSLTADIVGRALEGLAEDTDTEMMWYYVEKIAGLSYTVLPGAGSPPPKVRLTLDYQEDYWLLESVRRLVGNLASRQEVDELFVRNPDLYKINWFRNDEWRKAQVAKGQMADSPTGTE